MGRSTSGSEAESRKPKKNVTEHDDDHQAYRHKGDVPVESDQAVIRTMNKPKNRKPVDQLGSNGRIQKYSYAKEQESHEKRLYARNGKEAYQAYGFQRHAKEEYQGYSSNVRTGRRSSPPPKLQMMKYENPMLKKKAVACKENDSGTSSEEDEDEYRGNERVGRRSSPPPKLQMMKNQTDSMLKKKASAHKNYDRTSSKEDKDESSSSDDDKSSGYDVFKRMSRMELNSSKFMKTRMMKW